MVNAFIFYNDTNREVVVHPGTKMHGCECDMTPIKHLEERVFILPVGTVAWVKMWDYGRNLTILVSPRIMTKVEDDTAD